jgi:PAS domain S-box-containing protein
MHPLIRQFSMLSKSIPLRLILVIPFILQTSIAVGLVGWLSIRNGNQAVNDVAEQLRNETTARIHQYLKTYIATPQAIDQLNANAVQLKQLNFQDVPSVRYYLWRQIQIFDLANEIKFGTARGEFVAVERLKDGSFSGKNSSKATQYINTVYALDRMGQPAKLITQLKHFNPRMHPWYRAAIQAGKPMWGKIYKRPSSLRPVIPFSQPIYDAEHHLLGVAAVDFSLSGISKYLNGLKIGRSGETFIVDHDGLLIGSSTTQPIFTIHGQQVKRFKAADSQDMLTQSTARLLLDRFGNFAHVPNTQQLDFEINGQRQFVQVAPLQDQGLDWRIVVVVPEADFMDRINANTHTTILLCLTAFGVATGLGILTSRWITKPILHLSRASRAIASQLAKGETTEGDLDQTVHVQGVTEINVLAQSFNQMTQQLQESFAQLARTNEELELRVAQRTAALQCSEAKYRGIFDNSQIGILRLQPKDGLFLDANQHLSYMLGYDSPAELIGIRRTKDFFVNLSDRTKIRKAYRANRAFDNFEIQLRKRDGSTFWALISSCLTEAGHGECVISDISDRKQAEAALQAAMEAADVANRAKSQFLSHMSHELRSPLNVILGFTQLTLRNGSLTIQQQDYIDTINASGEHLLSLINDVLELSKIEAGRTTLHEVTCDFYELLNWVYQTLNLKARAKGLELTTDWAIDLPQYIYLDEGKLRQILMNLLGNAIKFTQAGKVILRVRTEHQEEHQSLIYCLLFEVEDTGVGIAPAELDTLFEPFVQTRSGRNSYEGTGLGLPISQQFIRLMGGEITVRSRLGAGTIFQFWIPAGAADEVTALAPSLQVVGLEAGQPTYRILVVEDKREHRQILVELLSSVGFEVREAENGQEAIALWRSWLPHLIWMDIRMPVLDGLAATQQIKTGNSSSSPVIIAVSGSAFEEDRVEALSTGFDDFVRKPIRAEVIFDKMAEHLGVRYRYAEAIESQIAEQIPFCLTSCDLANFPAEWVEQLYQAATNVNAKQIKDLLQQISPSQTDLAKAITHLVNNFQFDEVVRWTQQRSQD